MNEEHKINLRWQGNSLYMGKVCVGTVKSFSGNCFKTYYPDKFADYSQLICFGLTVYPFIFRTLDEARTHLESFIRDQVQS